MHLLVHQMTMPQPLTAVLLLLLMLMMLMLRAGMEGVLELNSLPAFYQIWNVQLESKWHLFYVALIPLIILLSICHVIVHDQVVMVVDGCFRIVHIVRVFVTSF